MENYITLSWYYNTSWDYEKFGKININYILV
jgi:hypothetical protein